MRLHGRESELAACRSALCGHRHASGIVISGEPGIGKTALHQTVVGLAADGGARVLFTTGLEAAIPLSNLADLLDPAVREFLPGLPSVQAAALRTVLRLAEAQTPLDDALLARAVVNSFRALAGARLLVAIDDEQWLDSDTRRLLGMAAAWLTQMPVVWLVSVRDGHAESGLASTLVRALGPRAIRIGLDRLDSNYLTRLVIDRFPGRWSSRLLRQIVELSAGNPYAALELARETAVSAGCGAPAPQVPASLASSLETRLRRLGYPTVAVVQAASLTSRPTRLLLRAVVGLCADAGVDQAVEDGVLESAPADPVLRFTHPLLREVARASMSGPERQRMHRSLAAAVADSEERATHLAASAEEPDEALAEQLSNPVDHHGEPHSSRSH